MIKKLWLLQIPLAGYDTASGFVVCAEDETGARELAARNCGLEGANTWRFEAICTVIGIAVSATPVGVILRDFSSSG